MWYITREQSFCENGELIEGLLFGNDNELLAIIKQLEMNVFFCLRGCFEAILFKKHFTYLFKATVFNKLSGFIITMDVFFL